MQPFEAYGVLRIRIGEFEASLAVTVKLADALDKASVKCRRAAAGLRRSRAKRNP